MPFLLSAFVPITMRSPLFLLCWLPCAAFAQHLPTTIPTQPYNAAANPAAPNYANESAWAALPTRRDAADSLPKGFPKALAATLGNNQATATADVFFIHPTIYAGRRKEETNWNGPIDDPALNERTDGSTILNQASIFNAAGRVYAPRYRQAHVEAYYSTDTASSRRAFELAYTDIRAAFLYYLEHYNAGRPIIIAGHSQGTTHAGRLLREFFDGNDAAGKPKLLARQLVAAYAVGMPVPPNYFATLKPCATPTQTGCFCAWRTYERGTEMPKTANSVVVNPLSWTTDTLRVPFKANAGAVLFGFRYAAHVTDAQIHRGILWAVKPRFFGNFLYKEKSYHIADYNLYYLSVRQNAVQRVAAFGASK